MTNRPTTNARPGRGRPRHSAALRTAVVQRRGMEPRPSIDKILDYLSDRQDIYGPPPSRGWVAGVCQEWDQRPEEIRLRESPFRFHRLEEARIPWEGAASVMACWRAHLAMMVETAEIAQDTPPKRSDGFKRIVTEREPFTNRLACWCWRVHGAYPTLEPDDVIAVAVLYAREERLYDLVGEEMHLDGPDAWLAFRPNDDPKLADVYQKAGLLGLIEPPMDTDEEWERETGMTPLPRTTTAKVEALWFLWRRAHLFRAWHPEPTAAEQREKEAE
ncbi:MAG: hypothetical protein O3B84_00785 [Chloroflexi bacterium]|nr:hypothetical protein [Chloroflexota bacterium]